MNSVQSVGGLLFAECILPQISQIYTEVRLSSRGALVQSVGVTLLLRRQDTSATIFRTQRICVDLCNLWEDCCLLSVFSHRFHRFTQKLGCLQGGALCCCGGKDTSATIFRTQRICVNLCNLWEALLSSGFCEFRAICGRTAVCSVGALETSAPPEIAICGSHFAAAEARIPPLLSSAPNESV